MEKLVHINHTEVVFTTIVQTDRFYTRFENKPIKIQMDYLSPSQLYNPSLTVSPLLLKMPRGVNMSVILHQNKDTHFGLFAGNMTPVVRCTRMHNGNQLRACRKMRN